MTNIYSHFSSFVLRTPLLPFNSIKWLLNDKENIVRYIDNPHILESIFIASPGLFEEIHKLKTGEIKEQKEIDKVLFSIAKYISRMSTRCTPFGLFAGCSIGEIINGSTHITLNQSIKRHVRLDMYYLCTLSQKLLKIPEIKNKIKFFPNSTLYSVGNKYRYIEYEYEKSGRKHRISAVDKSLFLNKILRMSENGVRISDICNFLVSNDISEECASEYINELIDSQLIVSELSPTVTGDDFFNYLISVLESAIVEHPIVTQLKKIQLLLKQINEHGDVAKCVYESIKNIISEIGIPFEEKFIFQLDMTKSPDIAMIGQDILAEIKSAIDFLNEISIENRNEDMLKFIQAFSERYEEKKVPLMEALDPEMGIGYPVTRGSNLLLPILSDLAIPFKPNDSNMINISNFQYILLQKTIEALSNNKQEIIFVDNDIKDLKKNGSHLPSTFYCMFKVLRFIPNNILITLNSFSGSSGANLFARFSHTDIRIKEFVKEITDKEQDLNSEVIYAEIAHLPESRVGNILSRPHIRDYEILYLANSDLPKDKIIRMSDLTISIKNGLIILKSKKLNKVIIPRLTNAHNYHKDTMPVYKFLCDLQTQNNKQGIAFNWGSVGNLFPFKPRIRYKNIILSPATWTIKTSDLKMYFTINQEVLVDEVKKWREKLFIPSNVLLKDGDNELFIDFENDFSIQTLFTVIKRRSHFQLVEFLFDIDNSLIRDKNENPYLNECIVAFSTKEIKK